ncbi:MAG: glycosyltransferase family 39 protein [Spirochaetia bacterium]|nr:glycosyltransferase family 39 protein [Spirochaetia bacterium]
MGKKEKPPVLAAFLMVTAYFILLLPTLNSFRLLSLDEANYGAIAARAAFDGEWLPLVWKGGPFYDKPPFFIWIQALLLKAAGTTAEWPVRLPALASACIMWFYFILLAWRLSKSAAAASAIFVLGAFQKHSILYARCGTLDMALLACLMAAAWELSQAFEKGTEDPAGNIRLAGLWCSAAVLIKTWFGLALLVPAAAALYFVRPWPFKPREIWHLFIPPFLALLCWFVFGTIVSGVNTIGFEMGNNTFGRISGGGLSELFSGKSISAFAFWAAVFIGGTGYLWPALPAAAAAWGRCALGKKENFTSLMLFIFLAVWMVFIYLFITPYINYFLPVIPLSCLAIAAWAGNAGTPIAVFVFAAAPVISLAYGSGRIGGTTAFILSVVLAVSAVATIKKSGGKAVVTGILIVWAVISAASAAGFVISPPDQNGKLAEFVKYNGPGKRNSAVIWAGDPIEAQVMEFYAGWRVSVEKQIPDKSDVPVVVRNTGGGYAVIEP